MSDRQPNTHLTQLPKPHSLNVPKESTIGSFNHVRDGLDTSLSIISTSSSSNKSQTLTENTNIIIDGDAFIYKSNAYRPNDRALVHDVSISGLYSVKILGLSDGAVLVQKTDGTKRRLSLKGLTEGRIALVKKA